MDIDQINAFCRLAECGNYKTAAEQLCITQPALSKKIQKLEQDLETLLFERSRTGTSLTSSGALLLPEAKLVLHSYHQFSQSARSLRDGVKGRLKVGFGVSSYKEAPNIMSSFKEAFRFIDVSLHDLQSQHQIAMLERKELDVGFCRVDPQSQLASLPMFKDRLALVVPELADIGDNPIVYMKSAPYLNFQQFPAFGFTDQLNSYLAHANLHLHAKQESDSILTLLSMISANLGFSILPLSTKQIVRSGVRFIPLSGKYSEWDIFMIWNTANENRAVKQFVDFVTQSEIPKPHQSS